MRSPGFWCTVSFSAIMILSGPRVGLGQEATPHILTLVTDAETKQREAKWSDAVEAWKRVVKLNPIRGAYWQGLATSSYRNSNYRDAISAYEKVLELREGFPWSAAYDIACCYCLLDDKPNALKWLETAMKLGLRQPGMAKTDNDFKALHGDPRFREIIGDVDVTKMSRNEGWVHDIRYLSREIRRRHPNPYRVVSREATDKYVEELCAKVPQSSDDQLRVGLMRLAAMAGDGHTHARPPDPRKTAPIQMFLFDDGVFITAAAPGHEDLAGAQVIKIGKHTVEAAIAAVQPLISRDNDTGPKAIAPFILATPMLLHGLGLIPSPDKLPITVRGKDGKDRAVELPAGQNTVSEAWATAQPKTDKPALTMKNRNKAYWMETLPEARTVFFQYNSVRNDFGDPFPKFIERVIQTVEKAEFDRLVIDLRWNGGGNTFLHRPLLHAVIRCQKLATPGSLFVIIGRNTYSAAQNLATDLENHTPAIFVGEPTGSSPNFIGESVRFALPYSKTKVSISDLVWQRSWPMDYRTWIGPKIYAPPTFEAYRANRDPALEAILAYKHAK